MVNWFNWKPLRVPYSFSTEIEGWVRWLWNFATEWNFWSDRVKQETSFPAAEWGRHRRRKQVVCFLLSCRTRSFKPFRKWITTKDTAKRCGWRRGSCDDIGWSKLTWASPTCRLPSRKFISRCAQPFGSLLFEYFSLLSIQSVYSFLFSQRFNIR